MNREVSKIISLLIVAVVQFGAIRLVYFWQELSFALRVWG